MTNEEYQAHTMQIAMQQQRIAVETAEEQRKHVERLAKLKEEQAQLEIALLKKQVAHQEMLNRQQELLNQRQEYQSLIGEAVKE